MPTLTDSQIAEVSKTIQQIKTISNQTGVSPEVVVGVLTYFVHVSARIQVAAEKTAAKAAAPPK